MMVGSEHQYQSHYQKFQNHQNKMGIQTQLDGEVGFGYAGGDDGGVGNGDEGNCCHGGDGEIVDVGVGGDVTLSEERGCDGDMQGGQSAFGNAGLLHCSVQGYDYIWAVGVVS